MDSYFLLCATSAKSTRKIETTILLSYVYNTLFSLDSLSQWSAAVKADFLRCIMQHFIFYILFNNWIFICLAIWADCLKANLYLYIRTHEISNAGNFLQWKLRWLKRNILLAEWIVRLGTNQICTIWLVQYHRNQMCK